jgi:hypothetical protein
MFQFIRKVQQSVRNAALFGNGARRRRSLSAADSFEPRTLLASLVSATKISYQDADGDNVTVTLSKAVLTAGNVNSIFAFDVGTVDGSNTTKQQLRTINLTGVAGIAGTTITTAAVRSATNGGDGFAALGQINATGIDIGAVTIDGDLGRILAGDATTSTQGLGALKVHSMGRYGTLSGATNLESVIQGKLASLTTKTDVKDASIDVQGGANGQIGPITIGGSLLGNVSSNGDIGPATISGDFGQHIPFMTGIYSGGGIANVSIGGHVNGGNIFSVSDMGAIQVAGDVTGRAGDSQQGLISSGGKLASVTIGGSLKGLSSFTNGRIQSGGDMGPVVIGGDLVGGLLGGATAPHDSGSIFSGGKLTSVTIGGSLKGGSYSGNGKVYSTLDMGPVNVKGSVTGGTAFETGNISTGGRLSSITIGGSLIGGSGSASGQVSSQLDMGAATVTGSVFGADGSGSGRIVSSGKLASVMIGGSLFGGSGESSGQVFSQLDMGAVTVSGSVLGGVAGAATIEDEATGSIISHAKLGNVTIGGALQGGEEVWSGMIISGLDMGVVKVAGDVEREADVVNGFLSTSTRIMSGGKLAGIIVGGSLKSGGSISSQQDMGTVNVAGDVIAYNTNGGIFSAAKMGNVTIGGSVVGSGVNQGGIHSQGDMGTVTINGDLVGSWQSHNGAPGGYSGSVRSGGKLASVAINGSIIGGLYNGTGSISSALDMGPVVVKGSVIGGNGFVPSVGLHVGAGAIYSAGKLASVTIGGSLIGGSSTSHRSGYIFAAQDLTTLTISGSIIGGLAPVGGSAVESGYVEAKRIGSLTLNGSLIAGINNGNGSFNKSGSIRVADDIGNLTIKGHVIGNTTNRAIISARGLVAPPATSDLAIGKLNINGRVEYGWIIAGVQTSGNNANADAQIGPVVIGGDWIASSMSAGAIPGAGGAFGDANDAKMSGVGVKDIANVSSKITSIVIGGQVMGTPTLVNDHFGFVAENIGSFKVKGGTTTYSLTAGNSNDDILLSLIFGGLIGSDTRLNEI